MRRASMRKMLPIRWATTLPSACKETRLSCTWLFQGTNRERDHTTFKGVHLNFAWSLGFTNREEQLMLWHLNCSSLNSPPVLDGARANTAWRIGGDGLSAKSCVKTAYCISKPVLSATDVRDPPGLNIVEFIKDRSERMARRIPMRGRSWQFRQ